MTIKPQRNGELTPFSHHLAPFGRSMYGPLYMGSLGGKYRHIHHPLSVWDKHGPTICDSILVVLNFEGHFRLGNFIFISLRILGPSNGGVGTCIAGVRVLKIGTFEGSGYLGLGCEEKSKKKNTPQDAKKVASVKVTLYGIFPKIGGKLPQNGWFISWKTLLKWMIWGFSHYFWVDTHIAYDPRS